MYPVHFFIPLIPGFLSGQEIPLKFFSKYIEGGAHEKVVRLSSDISDTKYRVILEGRKLTSGWKEFALEHDYHEGDILIFSYSGEPYHFHVTGMAGNGVEIQYGAVPEAKEKKRKAEVHTAEVTEAKKKKQKVTDDKKKATIPQNTNEIHTAEVTDVKTATVRVTNDVLRRSRMFIPRDFATSNRLYGQAGQSISLMNETGDKWPVKIILDCEDRRQRLRFTGGLGKFLVANNFKANTEVLLQAIWESATNLVVKVTEM